MFGSRFLGTTGLLASVVMQKVLFLDVREALMPSLFHGAKIGERARNQRLLLAAIGAILVAAVVVAFLTILLMGHKIGLREMKMDWATQSHAGRVRERAKTDRRAHGPKPLDSELRRCRRPGSCSC